MILDKRKKLVWSEHLEIWTILNPVSTAKGVKLFKLEIAKYSGDPNEFLTFLEAFDATVNRDKSISNVQKFAFLKSFHTGDAAATIKGLPLKQY